MPLLSDHAIRRSHWGLVPALFACSVLTAAERPPLFEQLMSHTRPITTTSSQAQQYFNQGLAFLFAYNHAEAIRAFAAAAELDPDAPMPHWGVAYALGPHINYPLVDDPQAAWGALQRARDRAEGGTAVEQALILALSVRYALPQPDDRLPLDRAYADAMRAAYQQHRHDADVAALFAEALMDLRPWDLWTAEGQPQPETGELVAVLETLLKSHSEHPLGLHLYIHAVEGSPAPERAVAAAETLRKLPLKLGHLVHMPSHIDVRLGRWSQAIAVNELAVAIDDEYRRAVPEQGLYRTYMAHNHHMLAYAAMMQGRRARATAAIDSMLAEMPEQWVRENPAFADPFQAMPYELHLRFGRWEELLKEPEPFADLVISRAVRLYARGVAFAALQRIAEAREEQARFRAAAAALPTDAVFVLNKASDVFGVADRLLEGEILYREGRVDEALTALREAVQREDRLRYIEPPDWIQPVRHVLGATLSDAKRWADAEQVYRDDLAVHPHNGWALFGLAQSLRNQGQSDAAQQYDEQFRSAWRHADFQLTSSCLCLPGPTGR